MYHLHVSYAARLSGRTARGCIDYILRLGASANKSDLVLYAGSLNMPDWVADGAGISYWQAADGKRTRINGRLLYRVEFALPKELSLEQQIRAAWAFVRFLSRLCARGTSSQGVPASFAIHAGYGRNPHLHCLLSTSLVDGHQRTPDQWFKRHDPKRPSTTGAAKAVFMATFKWLREVRAGWARIGNAALVRADLPPVLDHRSNRDRGLPNAPGRHRGFRFARPAAGGRLSVAELWAARRRQATAQEVLEREALEAKHRQAELKLRTLLKEEAEDAGRWVRQHATCMFVTTDQEAIAGNAVLISSPGFADSLAAEIGDDWVWVPGQDAEGWLVHVDEGFVVYLSGGAVYTDVEANADVRAFTQVARTLSWPGARGASLDGHVAKFQGALRRVGIGVTMALLPAVGRQAGSGGAAVFVPKA